MPELPRIAVVSWIFSSTALWFLSRAISSELFLPYMAGAATLLIGVIRSRKEFLSTRGIDRITLLGPMFLAVPMAVFGADHFVFAREIAPLVPSWIPGHLFWVLFVGVCLVAGALALVLHRHATLAAALFGIMLCFFFVLMDIPALVQTPGDRFAWALALRDLTFGAGALCFAAAQAPARFARYAKLVLTLARIEIGLAAMFFAVEHFLHPEFKPAVPLRQLTPLWIPLRVPVAYLTGVFLLITGVALVLNKRTKLAATTLGLMLLLLTIALYGAITIANPSAIGDGLNYLGNTLMFSGGMLCLAGSDRTETGKQKIAGLTLSAPVGDYTR